MLIKFILMLLLSFPLFAADVTQGTFLSLLSNPWIFLVVIIIFSIIFIVTLTLKGKISVKLPGGSGFDIDSNSKNSKPVDNPHSKCPYSIDFRHAFTKITYVVSRISQIKYRECLEEQMKYTEEQFVNIRTMYQRAYLDKLKDNLKKKDEIKTEDKYLYEDYRYYQSVIKLLIHDIESVIRSSFANNHLVSYEQEEYQRYIDLKFNVIKALEIDFIDSMYVGDWVVTRDEIFDIHKDNRDELQKVITDVYIRARKIAFNKKNEIKKLEDELQEYMDSTVGNNVVIEKMPVAK